MRGAWQAVKAAAPHATRTWVRRVEMARRAASPKVYTNWGYSVGLDFSKFRLICLKLTNTIIDIYFNFIMKNQMTNRLHPFKWVLAALTWGLLAGCAQMGPVDSDTEAVAVVQPTRTNLEPLGAVFALDFVPNASQSRMVIYRGADAAMPGATGIFVEGSYHASLVVGAWSELCFRPGAVNLGARQMQVGTRAKDALDSISALTLRGGQNHFLKVIQENGRPVLKPVSQAQALREIQGAREQLHTISRVAELCQEAATPALIEPPTTLTAQVLFQFDKSDVRAIAPASLQALEGLLAQWAPSGLPLERVHVIGHADPLGDAAHNERLAQARAQTVREYLMRRLPQGVQVTIESRGANEPMVGDCEMRNTSRAISCHAPNRRVVVLLVGPSR